MTGYDRCRCRPGCLAPVTPADDVLLTDDGPALTEHLLEPFPGEQLALDMVGVA